MNKTEQARQGSWRFKSLQRAADTSRVPRRDELRAALGAGSRNDSRRVERVLNRNRHAVQRPERLTANQPRIGLPGKLDRPLPLHLHHGMDLRIDRANPGEKCTRDFFSAQSLRPSGSSERGGRSEMQLSCRIA